MHLQYSTHAVFCTLQVLGHERQSVRLAAQLPSESRGKALQRYYPQHSSLALFIQDLHKAFDVLNSRRP